MRRGKLHCTALHCTALHCTAQVIVSSASFDDAHPETLIIHLGEGSSAAEGEWVGAAADKGKKQLMCRSCAAHVQFMCRLCAGQAAE